MANYETLYKILYRCVVEAYKSLEQGRIIEGMEILAKAQLLTMLMDTTDLPLYPEK